MERAFIIMKTQQRAGAFSSTGEAMVREPHVLHLLLIDTGGRVETRERSDEAQSAARFVQQQLVETGTPGWNIQDYVLSRCSARCPSAVLALTARCASCNFRRYGLTGTKRSEERLEQAEVLARA